MSSRKWPAPSNRGKRIQPMAGGRRALDTWKIVELNTIEIMIMA